MRALLAGDWHGNSTAASKAFAVARQQDAQLLIQLGDFGYGWREGKAGSLCKFTDQMGRYAENYHLDLWFIDGNHENHDKLEAIGAADSDVPVELAPRVWYVPRGTLLPVGDSRVLFVGGAYSVDKWKRKPHVSWWPQEEITTGQLYRALSYERSGVDVVLSHDVANSGFLAALALGADEKESLEHLEWKNDRMFPDAKRNRMMLEEVLKHYRPERWFHGHYHADYTARVFSCGGETTFRGLAHECHKGALEVVEF